MNRKFALSILTIVFVVAIMAMVLSIIVPGQFGSALAGAIGGVMGGILFPAYMKRYEDERFNHLMDISARNMAVLFTVALPLLGAIIVLGTVSVTQAAMMIFGLWAGGICILYASLYYYYKQ